VSPVGDLIESFGVSYHQFANDTQLLVAMKVNDATPSLERLANCSAAVRSWFLWNDLQLNAGKSEAVILGTAPQLRSAASCHYPSGRDRTHAVTTDMWTASSNFSYMGVTAHWLDASFKVHNKCLAIHPAPGSHIADFITTELDAVLSEWSVCMSMVNVVTDSSANVNKAMTQLNVERWRPCFAHTLQLCVNGSINHKDVSDLPKILVKARTIVGHFRRSPLATTLSTQLERAQQQLDLPRHKLLQDCPTRWNSQVQ